MLNFCGEVVCKFVIAAQKVVNSVGEKISKKFTEWKSINFLHTHLLVFRPFSIANFSDFKEFNSKYTQFPQTLLIKLLFNKERLLWNFR